MSLRVVRLGSPRRPDEGLRLGTVRRPPRGVKQSDVAARDWYDVWLPALAPSPATVQLGRGVASAAEWRAFARRYGAEMKAPASRQALDLVAALSHRTDVSVGCYCEDEARCHRSLLRTLLRERGAALADDPDAA